MTAEPTQKEYKFRNNYITLWYTRGKLDRIVFQENDGTILYDGTEAQVNELFEAVKEVLNEK